MKQHPIFARFYERFSQGAEKRGLADMRKRMLAGLSGRVVEVGAGNGLNFSYYPAAVTEVVAVEPESFLRGKAQERASDAPVKISVVDGTAEALPLEDGSVDGAVVTLVLCSVEDQAVALAELSRVLKPGGSLVVIEHVVSERAPLAAFQTVFTNTAYKRMAGGCHLDRDTLTAIRNAGFEFAEPPERVGFQGLSWITGVATAPAG